MTKGSKKPNALPTTVVHVRLDVADIRKLEEYAKSQQPPCAMNALLRYIIKSWLKERP